MGRDGYASEGMWEGRAGESWQLFLCSKRAAVSRVRLVGWRVEGWAGEVVRVRGGEGCRDGVWRRRLVSW